VVSTFLRPVDSILQEMEARINNLLTITGNQQNQINRMSRGMRLKGLWRRLLIPHRSENDEEVNEDCVIAMCWLSAQCTQEVIQSMETEVQRRHSLPPQYPDSNVILNSLKPLYVAGDSSAHNGIMSRLLDKIHSLDLLAQKDVPSLKAEIAHLSGCLHAKAQEVDAALRQQQSLRQELERSRMESEERLQALR
jgi:hypothetical protein